MNAVSNVCKALRIAVLTARHQLGLGNKSPKPSCLKMMTFLHSLSWTLWVRMASASQQLGHQLEDAEVQGDLVLRLGSSGGFVTLVSC